MLLLIMVTLVTLYTGKIQSFEHQIVINTQNQLWAKAAAKSGLNQGLAMLSVNKDWIDNDISENLEDASSFVISAISEDLSHNRKLITVESIGKSADSLAKVKVSEQILIYPILFNVPIAPLMVKQGFTSSGELEVVINPNGLGVGEPLSLWSNVSVSLAGSSHHSCLQVEFDSGNCTSNAYSNHLVKQSDIVDNSASFPADLVSYLFNIPATNLLLLKEQADVVLAACDTLDIGSWGVIWVDGDCEISASTQIATQSDPIILIVFDGSVIFQSDVTFYGLVFSYKPASSSKVLDIQMQVNSVVVGAIATNHQLGVSSGITRVVYHQQVQENLQSSKELQRLARVPGSWHDF